MALTEKQLAQHRKYRENLTPEKREAKRLRALERYHERRSVDLPKMRQYSKKRFAADRRVALLDGAKRRAKLYNLPFDITIEDIIIPPTCPVLGIPIVTGGPANDPHLPSLDRFDPELGYVTGNITVMSLRANSLKKNATVEEVQALLNWMISRTAS